jgi:hypothetical protein
VVWTDWTSATAGTAGSASGTMGGVTVSYTGDLFFAQLTQTSGDVDAWQPTFTAYQTPAVDNLPPDHEILTLSQNGSSNTLTFSSPVVNLVMGIVSLGGGVGSLYGVDHDFDAPFTIISQGTGAYGSGPLSVLPGDVLHGEEGHGFIHFTGPLTSLSWTSTIAAYEGFNGFQIGTTVPEPSTGALLLAAATLAALVCRVRRNHV